jgi:pentatricopeptide repeat protein
MQACYVAQGVEVFRAMIDAKGFPCQRSYVTAISTLLKIRRRGLANRTLAYQLWQDLLSRSALPPTEEQQQMMELQAQQRQRLQQRQLAGSHHHHQQAAQQQAAPTLQPSQPQAQRQRQQLDVVSMRTGMNACVEVGRIGEARALLQRMREAKLSPGLGAYNILLKYHCRRGAMQEATQLFKVRRYLSAGKQRYSRAIHPRNFTHW